VRSKHTTKLGSLQRQPAQKELLRLVVDYDSADEFVADYDANLAANLATINTTRSIDVGTIFEVGLAFPGLMQPIVLDAIVQQKLENALTIALLPGGSPKLKAMVERVRKRDPLVVAQVLNVLIVEDNKHVCDLVRQGLVGSARREMKDITFNFSTAGDGAEALELLKTRTFDAAIVDVYLPVLDGASMIQLARTSLGLTKLPIITMSAGGEGARTAALKAGATVFLDKPVRLRDVVATMRQLLAV
jgi:CheY-like chemotaxis protein